MYICVCIYVYVYMCMYIYVCMGDNCICIYRSIYVGIYRRFSSYTTFGSAVPSMYGKYSLCQNHIVFNPRDGGFHLHSQELTS